MRRGDVLGAGDIRRHRVDARPAVVRERLDHGAVVRMQRAGDHGLAPLGQPLGHQHGFGRRRRAVVHRGVGDLHAGQHRDLRLELEHRLQRALADLGLIGRVAGQELGTLDQVIDGCRHVMPVGAATDEERHARGRGAARGEQRHLALDLELALRLRQLGQLRHQLAARHGCKKLVDRCDADAGEHGLAVGFGVRQIAHRRPFSVSAFRLRRSAAARCRSRPRSAPCWR